MPTQIGRIELNADRQRWTLLRPDGALSNWFARDANRSAVVATLAGYGITVDGADHCFSAEAR